MEIVQSGDAATWASVVVALVVGGLGFLVGLIGLVIAGLARADARKANLLAEKANGIADASNAIAVEANEIARTSVEQANETSDVRWDLVWLAPGQAQMRNIGRDQATEVRGEVTVDGVVQRFDLDVIEPDDGLVLAFPETAAALARDLENERLPKRDGTAHREGSSDRFTSRSRRCTDPITASAG